MPALVKHIGAQMQAWAEEQGGPFLLDGPDCQACAARLCLGRSLHSPVLARV